MNMRALVCVVAGSLLWAESGAAQPLDDLKARLAELRSDQPVRIEVEVELEHRGTAPLHFNANRQRGTAVVVSGRRGPRVREERWSGRSTHASVWSDDAPEAEPLVDELEAALVADPAGVLLDLLADVAVESDEAVTWEGRPARLLVVRPAEAPADRPAGKARRDATLPVLAEARIWLDETGAPLALERVGELRLGASLTLIESQTMTFQQAAGRLLLDEAREAHSGTALAVLRGRDDKRIRVIEVR